MVVDSARRARRWTGGLVRTWARHPRYGLAAKAALAASLAWAVVQLVPGPAAAYPYYAPLGAVIATSTTLAGSAREAAQTVVAISLGAAVALGVDALAYPNGATIAVVVALGVLLAGWRALGDSGSWVATAALFTLIIGDRDPFGYVAGYAGLTLLGAAIGLAVTAAFPPLPLAPAQAQLAQLRDLLADQLDDLAAGLRQESPPAGHEWQERMHAIDPVLNSTRTAVQLSDQARRGNRRARRYAEEAQQQYEHARALESLAFLVADVTELVREHETAELQMDEIAMGPTLRPPTAQALAAIAAALRSIADDAIGDDVVGDPAVVATARVAVEELAGHVRRQRTATGGDLFVAGSVVTTLRRCLTAVVAPGPADTRH
ncbi:hypothetical protein ASG41_11185 [Modestobacter sp. Leaf380]|nr:hypothetical protein ASG41_11185 [Modestobacter sp. Leaf380]